MSWGAFGMQALDKLVTNSSNLVGTGEMVEEQARKDARYDYAENERYGIMSRVEGAKAAGLHPLAALGFQASAPAQVVGGQGSQPSGQSYETRTPPPDKETDAEMRAAQLRLMNAQAADYETQAMERSQRKLATQAGQGKPMPTDPDNLIPGQGLRAGIKVEPNKIVAGKDGYQAGTHQGASVVRIPLGDGRTARINVPAGELSQGLEDMDIVKTLITLAMNRGKIMDFFTQDIPWAIGQDPRQNPVGSRSPYRPGYKAPTKSSGGASGRW